MRHNLDPPNPSPREGFWDSINVYKILPPLGRDGVGLNYVAHTGLANPNTQYGSAPALPCYMPSLQDLYNTGYNLLD